MRQLLLREENIVAGLEASDCKEALKEMVDFLPAWKLPGIEKKKVLQLLWAREQLGTTAIGRGIALPHCFSSEIQEPVIVFGVSRQGIAYSSLDGYPVHFIFMLILPQTEGAEQEKRRILQNIKWFLCDRHLQDRLLKAVSASEIYHLLAPEPQRQVAVGV